jgi:hypothetical protein
MQTVDSVVQAAQRVMERPDGKRRVVLLRDVVTELESRAPRLRGIRTHIREREGVQFFVSVSHLRNARATLDVRVYGVSVGTVEVHGGSRRFTPSDSRPLKGLRLSGTQTAEWENPTVRRYLEEATERLSSFGSREAAVEAELIHQLRNDKGASKPKLLHGHQPVTIAGIPLKLPLPVTGRGEDPDVRGFGRADILVRAGTPTRGLKVFEVKRPGESSDEYRHALVQAVTYCASLETLHTYDPGLSSRLWRVFGYPKGRGSQRTIATAVLPTSARKAAEDSIRALSASNDHGIGLEVLFYDWEPGKLVLHAGPTSRPVPGGD